MFGAGHLEHRFMQVRVEALARLRGDFANPVALEDRQQLPLGHLDAFDHRLDAFGGAVALVVLKRLDGAPQIVGHLQHVAGEIGCRIARRIRLVALGALAGVFHFGRDPEQPVLQIGDLGLKRCCVRSGLDRPGRRGVGRLALPGRLGRQRFGQFCGCFGRSGVGFAVFVAHGASSRVHVVYRLFRRVHVRAGGRYVNPAACLTRPALIDQPADQLGRVVDHWNDARVIEPRRPDHAEHAHHMLLGVHIGADDQR